MFMYLMQIQRRNFILNTIILEIIITIFFIIFLLTDLFLNIDFQKTIYQIILGLCLFFFIKTNSFFLYFRIQKLYVFFVFYPYFFLHLLLLLNFLNFFLLRITQKSKTEILFKIKNVFFFKFLFYHNALFLNQQIIQINR
ncbi:hypothetical protein IMG5_126460 [Ichthyophthirius multifiliis]|uniref:Transmembrane protein n=1 Tax=Ichthyophthirius multifiliis TaxID=5932 RepID=G0QVU3_ICHMU|nr:hypothetical protein IMG5_126460 [Ichthyophthirius multifiliis]EGR30665.1 hypothetical protein IMG5_126460 [Ichthyophthirius multifiliis]|eukprot:XP_004032252.1 hypothetical protein IMG5_126460 [Ichthyophthirius multifiliis]